MRFVVFRVSLVLCLLAPSAALEGSQAWGTWRANASSPVLFALDVTTGAMLEKISMSTSLSIMSIRDLAADPVTQGTAVWGVRRSFSQNELIAMDPSRSAVLSRVDLNASEPIEALAIDPTSGEFYGTSEEALYRMDPGTGATTLVGTTSLTVYKGLGFDLQGNLFGIANRNQLVEIDKLTADISLRATLDVSRMEDIAGCLVSSKEACV